MLMIKIATKDLDNHIYVRLYDTEQIQRKNHYEWQWIKGWDSVNGDNVKGITQLGLGRGCGIFRGLYGASSNSSSYAKSSWGLKELTEGAVTVGMGSIFQYFSSHV